MMGHYVPYQNGIAATCADEVVYQEFSPSPQLSTIVYCFWRLEASRLTEPFSYVVLPDACIDIVFDMRQAKAYVMTPAVVSWQLDLGKTFSYVGIRLRPGAYNGDVAAVIGAVRQLDEIGGRSAQKTIADLCNGDRDSQLRALSECANTMVRCHEIMSPHYVVEAVIAGCVQGKSIADSASDVGLSPRHVQRIIREQTGFSPRDIAKIVRFQAGFAEDWRSLYCDQAHYIHSFKRVTQQTPAAYHRYYNV